MPYSATAQLPPGVRKLPAHGQEIYMAAFNAAFKQYDGDEAKAHATAWAAVKTQYKQDADGNWTAKESREADMTMTMGNKREILRNALAEKFPTSERGPYFYVEDLTETEVIYTYDEQLFKAPYTISENGRAVIGEGINVRRETTYPVIEALRAKYRELVQELAIREPTDTGQRADVILGQCNRILNEENPEGRLIKEIMDEAIQCLTWLQEAPVVKKEGGKSYPIQAYAYAPNKFRPESWQLRTWEDLDKGVTKRQLAAAAAYLSPGGNSGIKAKVPAAARASVKRHLRAAYRKLGLEANIPKWISEAETREHFYSFVPLTEATVIDSKGRASIIVIKAGFNTSQSRYYPKEVLQRDYGIFEGSKMYADHPTEAEDAARPERSIKDWVATLTEVSCDENGTVTGVATVHEDWLKQKLASLSESGMLSEMGISIDAIGSASQGIIDGTETQVLERLVNARSVDFVTEPGAGGEVKFYEADRQQDIDLLDLPALKERRPDLIKTLDTEIRAELKVEEGHRMDNEQEIKDKDTQIEALTKERDTMKAQMEEAAKVALVAEAKAIVEKAVGEATLPDVAKARLIAQFTDATSADGLQEAIKAEVKYIAELTEAGKVKGLGPNGNQERLSETSTDALKAAMKRLNPEYTDAQLDTAVTGR